MAIVQYTCNEALCIMVLFIIFHANKIHFDSNFTIGYALKGFGNLQTHNLKKVWKPRKA